MSFHFSLFIGPYAEWLVRRGRTPPRDLDEEPWFEPLIEGEILTLATRGDFPEVKVGRSRYIRYRFLPRQHRPNGPPRQMSFHDGMDNGGGGDDWSWLLPKVEMDWFSEAFAPELAVLAAHFGSEPTMGWGAFMVF